MVLPRGDYNRFTTVREIYSACFNGTCYYLIQVMIDTASGEERDTLGHRSKQLESLTRQNKLIDQENKNIDMVKKEHVHIIALSLVLIMPAHILSARAVAMV